MKAERNIKEIKRQHELGLYRARLDMFWPAYVKESAHVLPGQELQALKVCVESALGLTDGLDDATKAVLGNLEKKPLTLMKNRVVKVFNYVAHPDTLRGNYASFKKPFVSMGREGLKFNENLAEAGERTTNDYYAYGKSFYDNYIK